MWHLKKKASSKLKFFTIIGKMENLETDWGRDGLYITFEVKGIRFFDYPDQCFADNGDIVEVTYCYLSPESPSVTHVLILAKYSFVLSIVLCAYRRSRPAAVVLRAVVKCLRCF